MRKLLLLILLGLSLQFNALANVKLPKIFGDHMVLQRNKELSIWGWASPGERIEVSLNKQKNVVVSNPVGEWKAILKAEKEGGPYQLQVSGENTVVINDVLFGDVWIASGQSNMEWTVAQSGNAEQEIQTADFDKIRHFKVPNTVAGVPLNDLEKNAEWKKADQENVGSFSAVAYFFARKIFQETGVPIGIVNSTWGGTEIETWISAGALKNNNILAQQAETAFPGNKLDKKTNPNNYPSLLFNAMINPIKNLSVKGVIWYQGESNALRAFQYQKAFPVLIKDWRMQFKQGDFPFYFVQLASFDASNGNSTVGSTWAELREAQAKTLSLLNTGMATAIDIGEAKDIHPKNKQDVGLRLAAIALNRDYKQGNAYRGPALKEITLKDNRIIVHYSNAEGGFKTAPIISGFEIAGTDRKFYPAAATIQRNTIELMSEKVRKPVAVRYAWADNPGPLNLYNIEGFAAEPFRSDNWNSITSSLKYEDKFKAALPK